MAAAKLTDLDNLCLEKICGYLDVKSLLNASNVNKSMQAASVSAYRQNFRTKTIWLHDVRKPNIHVLGDKIFVDGLKLILPFLRLFGANISKLIIMFRKTGGHHQRIDEYTHRYCADTLSSISFHNKVDFLIDYSKPFSKVETVRIVNAALHENLRRCIDWFPNMRHLEIDTSSIYRCSDANVQFPHLEHLKINHNAIYFHQAEDLLRSNAQLQSFHIYAEHCNYFISSLHLMHMISGNSRLTKLTALITEMPITIAHATEAQQLITEHPLMVELDLKSHQFNASDALRITRELSSLKKFCFQIDEVEYHRLVNQLSNEWQHVRGEADHIRSNIYPIILSR